MLLMGYYSLDPLGTGFFRVDPAITLPPEALAFYSETTSFRAAAKAVGEVSEEIAERVAKEIAEEVAKTVNEKTGKIVAKNVAEKTSKEVMQKAYKNVQEAALEKNGKELSGGALLQALRKEAKLLATESLEAASKDVAATTTKKVAKKEARETAVERYAKFATSKGLFYGTAFAILKVPAEALADVIGDTADTFLGNDCDRADTEEKYPDESSEQIDARMEACEAEGFKRTMMLGAAGLGLVGILGALIVTRLVPKKQATQPDGETGA
jgi:hypothetical protein